MCERSSGGCVCVADVSTAVRAGLRFTRELKKKNRRVSSAPRTRRSRARFTVFVVFLFPRHFSNVPTSRAFALDGEPRDTPF